jgi:hypothetical protein
MSTKVGVTSGVGATTRITSSSLRVLRVLYFRKTQSDGAHGAACIVEQRLRVAGVRDGNGLAARRAIP